MLEYEREWVFGTPVCRSVDHDACHLAMSMPMNIVISDDYQECVRTLDCFALLRPHTVVIHRDTVTEFDALVQRFFNADAIVLIRDSTRVTAPLLASLPRLKCIAQIGAVDDSLDLDACIARGIHVTQSKGSGAATAEFTMLLILASLRHLESEVARLKRGEWQGSLGRQLKGRTLGVFGYGRIGQHVCQLAAAFGANILVWGREGSLARARAHGFAVANTRDEFFAQCDVLSLHIRLTDSSRHLVRAADLARMKRDSVLINTSRAQIIEPDALEHALRLGAPGCAAVDVYMHEPVLDTNHPLLRMSNCLCTPHLGFVERDNFEAYFTSAFASINAFAATLDC